VSQHAFDGAAFELADALPTLHTLHVPPLDAEVVTAARRSAGALATVSRSAQAAWQAATGREIGVLRNGVRDLTPARGAIAPVALIAGRISPEKGTATAIRVARRAGLAVLAAGDAYDPDYYENVVRPMLRPGEWIGCVSREVLSQLMARCAIVLMPVEWDEAFGLVAAEAQMAGCPVVAYRRGAMPDVVQHGSGGWLVEPGDEDALVAAVPLARALDRRAIRRDAQRQLGIGPMVDAYEHALHEVAATSVAMAS
jgi:glycosyltransferase involved in cell wall biosynthesis